MKKSVLAILLSSIFMMTACDDKNLSQKVVEAEKRVVQLEADYKLAQSDLASKEQELVKLKAEYDAVKSQCSQITDKKSDFPALQVKIVPLFEQSETIERKPIEKGDEPSSIAVTVFASTASTGIQWLDDLLISEMYNNYQSEDDKKSPQIPASKKALEQKLRDVYQEEIAEIKSELSESGYASPREEIITTSYLGQRNNLVSFTQDYYSYQGGAHGLGHSRYLNIDINKKAVLTLNDLFSAKNQAEVKKLLWLAYKAERQDDRVIDEKDFFVAEDFYFTRNGITFVYPVYTLASYAEGETELSLSIYDINQFLNKEYQYTEKDGYSSVEE